MALALIKKLKEIIIVILTLSFIHSFECVSMLFVLNLSFLWFNFLTFESNIQNEF